MKKSDYITGVMNIIEGVSVVDSEDLTPTEETAITDAIAAYCETVNPTNDYPPVAR